MDAYSSTADLSYASAPPALIFGSDQDAISRAVPAIEASGLRVGARLPLEAAEARLDQQASTSAIWIELAPDDDEVPYSLIHKLNELVASRRCAAVVSAPTNLVEPLMRDLHTDAELILSPDSAERVSALTMAMRRAFERTEVRELASDRNAERLRQLSDEVGRIAATLARLSTGPSTPPTPVMHAANTDAPHVSAETVRAVIKARRLRSRFFSEELFADPAWDMLLDLLQAEISQLRVPVSSLCIAAAVPATTALRWLKTMVSQGLFLRRDDQHDGRRVFVELAPETSAALRRYFAEVGPAAVI